jgi:hypothetical protein
LFAADRALRFLLRADQFEGEGASWSAVGTVWRVAGATIEGVEQPMDGLG